MKQEWSIFIKFGCELIINNVISNHSFDKDRIYNYVKKFSFPRLVGTQGEKKAVELTTNTFKQIGFEEEQITQDSFRFSNFYSVHLIKLIILMNLISITILFAIKYLYPLFTFITIIIIAIIVFLMINVCRHPELKGFWEKYWGKWISATSVFTKIPAKTLSSIEAGNLIISAHLDSKSQSYKTLWRVLLYRIWLYSEISLTLFYVGFLITLHELFEFHNIIIFIYEVGIVISTFLLIISNIFLLFLKTNNKSCGALDNASGMAIIFELSSYFVSNPLDNFNLWFCQFSAEEIGTMGSRNFLDNRENQFSIGKTFQINFDMLSLLNHRKNQIEYIKSYGLIPRKKISPLLNEYLQKAAASENLTIFSFHTSIGAHTDSIPFHLRKYDSVDIITRAACKYTHSKKDTYDKVDPLILLDTCRIAKKTILMLDRDFKLFNKD